MVKIRLCLAVIIMLFISVMVNSCAYFYERPERTAEFYFFHQDYREAFSRMWWPANLGKPRAQYALGYMYYYGLGVPVDHDMARVWFSHSAVQNYQPAKTAIKMLTNPEFVQFDSLTNLSTLHPIHYTYKQYTVEADTLWVRERLGSNYTVFITRSPDLDIVEQCLARNKIQLRVIKYRYREAGNLYVAAVAGNFVTLPEAEAAAAHLNQTLQITTAQPILWRNVHQIMLPL